MNELSKSLLRMSAQIYKLEKFKDDALEEFAARDAEIARLKGEVAVLESHVDDARSLEYAANEENERLRGEVAVLERALRNQAEGLPGAEDRWTHKWKKQARKELEDK